MGGGRRNRRTPFPQVYFTPLFFPASPEKSDSPPPIKGSLMSGLKSLLDTFLFVIHIRILFNYLIEALAACYMACRWTVQLVCWTWRRACYLVWKGLCSDRQDESASDR